VLRVADRDLEDVGESPGAEVAQEQQPAAERSGNARREDAGARDELVPELAEPLDGRRGRRHALTAEREWLFALRRPEHRGELSSRTVQVRLDAPKDQARCDSCVERVSAPLEHAHPGLGG